MDENPSLLSLGLDTASAADSDDFQGCTTGAGSAESSGGFSSAPSNSEEGGEGGGLNALLAGLKAKYGLGAAHHPLEEGSFLLTDPPAAAAAEGTAEGLDAHALPVAASPPEYGGSTGAAEAGVPPPDLPVSSQPSEEPSWEVAASEPSSTYDATAPPDATPAVEGGDAAEFAQLLLLEQLLQEQSSGAMASPSSAGSLRGGSSAPLSPCTSSQAGGAVLSPTATAAPTSPAHVVTPADEHAPTRPSSGTAACVGAEPHTSSSCGEGMQPDWEALNSMLLQQGFPPVLGETGADTLPPGQQRPDSCAAFTALHSLLGQHMRSQQHIQRLGQSAQGVRQREAALLQSFSAAAKQRDQQVAKWKRLALDNQRAAREAQMSGGQDRGAAERAACEARRLGAAVQQLQHELRSKEAVVDRLQQHLAMHLERDSRRTEADKEAYERLKRTYAASKAATTPTAAAAMVAAAAQDLKPYHLVRIFEADRANLHEQLAKTQAENQLLGGQLRRAREALHAAGVRCEDFEALEGQARVAARAAALAEERRARAEEEAEALRRELADRPTAQEHASLQRQVEILDCKLAKLAGDKAAAAAKENSGKARLKERSTREMILRDRTLKKLGLYATEQLPKPVLVEVLQDACLLLECGQPLELCSAIRPVQDAAALVPRMERFVSDVCGAVFQKGLVHVPEELRQDNPSDVPAVLAAWVAELSELVEMQGTIRALCRQLASRVSIQPGDPPPVAGQVVPLVAQLVELERQVFHSKEVIQAAEAALSSQPELLINRIVAQFQRLFSCRSLEGVLPAMNKLYLAHTESQTFGASLRSALGLDPSATLEACANAIQLLVVDRGDVLAGMQPRKEACDVAPPPPSSQAVVREVAPRQERELQQAAVAAIERMAAKRHWPTVEIFVPAPRQREPLQEQPLNASN